MGDGDNDEGAQCIDSFSNLSEAEKRRLRRRQKILGNQGGRLQRILSDDPSKLSPENAAAPPVESSFGSGDNTDSYSAPSTSYSEIFGEKGSKVSTITTGSKEPHSSTSSVHSKSGNKMESKDPPNLNDLLQGLTSDAGFTNQEPKATAAPDQNIRIGVQSDGSVILPKVSNQLGRVLACLLGLFLSICKAKQYLVTFISLEVAFYFINGLPPMPPPNMVMVLAAVMGLREEQLQRIKKFLHLLNCLAIDFSLYLTCVLLPHVVSTFIS